MPRDLATLLDRHVPADAREEADLARMRREVHALEAPLSRHQPGAHFTASAVVVTPTGERVALVHHGKLDRWLQPGGHVEPADGDDLLAAALREAREETGCEVHAHPAAPRPLDVDVHVIPARKADAEHAHLDVRFLLVAADPSRLQHDAAESHAAGWFGWEEALARADEAPLRRMLRKARALCGA